MIESVLVIASGSAGNCYRLIADDGTQLMLEFGIKYSNLIKDFNIKNLVGAFYSHTDDDHYHSYSNLQLAGIDIYGPDHFLEAGKLVELGNWQILPIQVPHRDVKCFSYIVKHRNSKLLFCTDLEQLPQVADTSPFDFMLLEANYIADIVENKCKNGEPYNLGCYTHLSLEQGIEWLKKRKNKPKNLIIIHTSNSGLFDKEVALKKLKGSANNIFIAIPYLEIRNKGE